MILWGMFQAISAIKLSILWIIKKMPQKPREKKRKREQVEAACVASRKLLWSFNVFRLLLVEIENAFRHATNKWTVGGDLIDAEKETDSFVSIVNEMFVFTCQKNNESSIKYAPLSHCRHDDWFASFNWTAFWRELGVSW